MEEIEMTLCPNCSAIAAKLDEAEERIRRLEAELGARAPFPPLLGLTPTQERLLSVLLKRDCVSFACMDGLFPSDNGSNIAKVHICNLREKLAPLNIEIETRWGRGYSMTPEMKSKLKRLILPQATQLQ